MYDICIHVIYLYVCLSACLPVCLSACLPVYLSICLSNYPAASPRSLRLDLPHLGLETHVEHAVGLPAILIAKINILRILLLLLLLIIIIMITIILLLIIIIIMIMIIIIIMIILLILSLLIVILVIIHVEHAVGLPAVARTQRGWH